MGVGYRQIRAVFDINNDRDFTQNRAKSTTNYIGVIIVGTMGSPGRPKQFTDERVTKALRIPKDLDHRLKAEAQTRDTSVNLLINRAIEHYLTVLRPIDDTLVLDSA